MVIESLNHCTLSGCLEYLRLAYRGGQALCRARLHVEERHAVDGPQSFRLGLEAPGAMGEKLGACQEGAYVMVEGALRWRVVRLRSGEDKSGFLLAVSHLTVLMPAPGAK